MWVGAIFGLVVILLMIDVVVGIREYRQGRRNMALLDGIKTEVARAVALTQQAADGVARLQAGAVDPAEAAAVQASLTAANDQLESVVKALPAAV